MSDVLNNEDLKNTPDLDEEFPDVEENREEEKEEPLEKNIKNRQEFVRYKVKRGGRNILPVGKSGEFAL